MKKITNKTNKKGTIQKRVNLKVPTTQKMSYLRKPVKTISGVAPLAVMLPPRKCDHGACLYCPSLNAPQSYTPKSPAVLRAASLDYDPVRQVKTRLKMFEGMRHPTDKIELIIMGGTFLQYDSKFQYDSIKKCYDAFNGKKSKNLEDAKRMNETAKHRCVALCIETRPDKCSDSDIKRILEFGATRVELGVQAVDDEIYSKINRGHSVKDVVDATSRLKKAGFKIGYHLMPGLPGSNVKKDIKMFKKIFSDERFKPDQIKIYPCQVLKGAKLEDLYYSGGYVPYDKETVKGLLIKFLRLTPRYCRIMRIMREIPQSFLIAGVVNIDLRKDVEDEVRLTRAMKKIKEIRFREIGFALQSGIKIDNKIKLKMTSYKASGGKEIFIEAVNKDDILFGLLRLRIDKDGKKEFNAMVRELHVYGPALNLGENGGVNSMNHIQHKGLGKEMLQFAEQMAIKNKCKTMRIISGVGVREYYKKLGFSLDNEKIYMERHFI